MSDNITGSGQLYRLAKSIAQDAWDESEGCIDTAQDYIHESCDGSEHVIYTHKALSICCHCDTSDGEQWLEDCGVIAQDGDTFDAIACRVAFATLYCAAMDCLSEIEENANEEEESE